MNDTSKKIETLLDDYFCKLRKEADNNWTDAYKKAEDLINIGAYQKGSNPTIDRAIMQIDSINQMLKQAVEEKIDPQMSLRQLLGIVNAYK